MLQRSSKRQSVLKKKALTVRSTNILIPLTEQKYGVDCKINLRNRKGKENLSDAVILVSDQHVCNVKQNKTIKSKNMNNSENTDNKSQLPIPSNDCQNCEFSPKSCKNICRKKSISKKRKSVPLLSNEADINNCVNKNTVKNDQKCPIWKQLQEKNNHSMKKRSVDVYDITADEDLNKEELENKIQTKMNKKLKLNKEGKSKKTKVVSKPKKSRIPIKSEEKSSHKLENHCNSVSDKLSHSMPFYKISSETEEHVNNNDISAPSNKLKLPVNIIVGEKFGTDNKPAPVKPFKQKEGNKNDPIVYINNLKIAPSIDSGKQVPSEKTPLKEIQVNSIPAEASKAMKNLNKQEPVFLAPKMTSTPEMDIRPCTAALVAPGNSFITRMSEIPTIPGTCDNLVEEDSADEDLVYTSNDIRFEDLPLFASPAKPKPEKNTVGLKQLKLDFFTKKNLEHFDVNLFDSPPKKEKSRSPSDLELREPASPKRVVKKPRKSYENLDHVRVNISKYKKTEGVVKDTEKKVKEEELIKSLNEHFSEVENFEFCIE